MKKEELHSYAAYMAGYKTAKKGLEPLSIEDFKNVHNLINDFLCSQQKIQGKE